MPLLRELVAGGRLVHDGGAELAAQVEAARVVEAAAGGLTLSTRSGRSDLLRAATWAVAAQVNTALLPFYVFGCGARTCLNRNRPRGRRLVAEACRVDTTGSVRNSIEKGKRMDSSNYRAICHYPYCTFDATGDDAIADAKLAEHLASGIHDDEPRRHVEKVKRMAYEVHDHVTGECVLLTLDKAEANRKAAELDD